MRISPKLLKHWKDLCHHLDELNGLSPMETFLRVQRWMVERVELFSTEPFGTYGLGRYVDLEVATLPIDYSPLRGHAFLDRRVFFVSHEPKNAEDIARRLRDLLETLVVFSAEEEDCPRCGRYGQWVYAEAASRQLVLECARCGFARTSDGNSFTGTVDFATVDDLKSTYLNID